MGEWSGSSLSSLVIEDQGPWARYPTVLWPALADPRNHSQRAWPEEDEGHDKHIAHWMPLLALTMGSLGWVRPDLGIGRWIQRGAPLDGPALQLLHRWWGRRAEGLVQWGQDDHHLPTICSQVQSALGLDAGGVGLPDAWAPSPLRARYPRLATGDGMHLHHVVDHLVGKPLALGQMLNVKPAADEQAVLLLDRYTGWYRRLHEYGSELPTRPDHRSWRVEVVVRSIGSLGTYRRSRMTGRWFAGCHRWHVLGSPLHGD